MDYLRIFYYLNVSNELPVDSGFHVAYNLITQAMNKTDDLAFYLTIPWEYFDYAAKKFREWIGERVSLVPIFNLPHYSMNKLVLPIIFREFFRKRIIHIFFINEPHLFPTFFSFLEASFLSRTPIVFYFHWFMFKPFYRSKMKDFYRKYLSAIFSGDFYVGVNSQYSLKILDHHQVKYSEENLYICPPGFNKDHIVSARKERKLLVFNQRVSKYTGAPVVLKALAEQECDLRFIFTNSRNLLASSIKRKAEKRNKIAFFYGLPEEEYYKLLGKAGGVMCWHEPYVNQWSIALCEAVASRCLPVIHDDVFYPELLGNIPRYSGKSLVERLKEYEENYQSLRRNFDFNYVERWSWEKVADRWIKMFYDAWESGKVAKKTHYRRLMRFRKIMPSISRLRLAYEKLFGSTQFTTKMTHLTRYIREDRLYEDVDGIWYIHDFDGWLEEFLE